MKKEYKEGVDLVFEQNPELVKIGTKEQYSKYLKTIFPESKIKNIVYHGSNNFDFRGDFSDKSIYKNDKGIYFSKSKRVSLTYALDTQKTFPAILNLTNLKVINAKDLEFNKLKSLVNYKGQEYKNIEKLSEAIKKGGDYNGLIVKNVKDDRLGFNSKNISNTLVAFDPSQIHILGSKKDIKEFGKYVKYKSKKTQKGNSLENKLISGVFIAFFIAGLFFISPSLTGNVIGNSNISILNIFGVALILIGAVGFFISKKYKYKR